tara:strand:- start:8860 stop:9867 length:1008 start_codon:yes stop_codon:yes gene_type:complete
MDTEMLTTNETDTAEESIISDTETSQEGESSESEQVSLENISEDDISSLSDEELEGLRNQTVNEESETGEESQGDDTEKSVVQGKSSKPTKPKDQMTTSERMEMLEKQIEVLEKVKGDRGTHIEKQDSVISGLKSKLDSLSEHRNKLDKKTSNQSYWEDPNGAMDAKVEKVQVEQQIAQAESELAYRENKESITQVFPDFEDCVEDLVEYFKVADPAREIVKDGKKVIVGTHAEAIAAFKKDPFMMKSDIAIATVKAARIFKSEKLQKQKVELLKNKPRQILDKVNKAAQYRTATSAPGGTSESNASDVSSADISKMSGKELQSFIISSRKQLGR